MAALRRPGSKQLSQTKNSWTGHQYERPSANSNWLARRPLPRCCWKLQEARKTNFIGLGSISLLTNPIKITDRKQVIHRSNAKLSIHPCALQSLSGCDAYILTECRAAMHSLPPPVATQGNCEC